MDDNMDDNMEDNMDDNIRYMYCKKYVLSFFLYIFYWVFLIQCITILRTGSGYVGQAKTRTLAATFYMYLSMI